MEFLVDGLTLCDLCFIVLHSFLGALIGTDVVDFFRLAHDTDRSCVNRLYDTNPNNALSIKGWRTTPIILNMFASPLILGLFWWSRSKTLDCSTVLPKCAYKNYPPRKKSISHLQKMETHRFKNAFREYGFVSFQEHTNACNLSLAQLQQCLVFAKSIHQGCLAALQTQPEAIFTRRPGVFRMG